MTNQNADFAHLEAWNASASIDTSVRLSGAARTALKSAIAAAPVWDKFRNTVLGGRNTGNLTKAELLRVAHCFGLNVASAFPAADAGDEDTSDAAAPVAHAAPIGMAAAIDAVRASIDTMKPFLADKLLGELETSVAALVLAAKDAVADAEMNAAPAAPAGALPYAKPIAQEPADKLFPGLKNPAFKTLSLRVWDAIDAPRVDDDFVFQDDILLDLLVSIERGRTVWLAGPAGTGKTSLPREIAARLRRPCVRIAHDRTTEPVELIGGRFPSADGATEWRDGVLTAAIRRPGTVIILDEPTFCRAGVLSTYQTLLDHRFLVLKENGGERVDCARGVVFVIADNTAGNGDMTGRYADTNTMNAAFIDRAAKTVHVDYLPRLLEMKALAARSGCNKAVATMLVDFAAKTRKECEQGNVTAGLSFRRLIEMAIDIDAGIPARRAFQNCILNQLPSDDATAVNELAKAHLDFGALENAASGKAPVSKAGADFDDVKL